jgi:hypothetical protein
MALRTQTGGTAEVDIASGRTRHILFEQRLHAGAYDSATQEEITFAPSR